MESTYVGKPCWKGRRLKDVFLGHVQAVSHPQTILQAAGSVLSHGLLLGPEGWSGGWEAEESPWRENAWMIRGGKKEEHLLCIPISRLVSGVGISLLEAISLAILLLLVRAVSRVGSWVVRPCFPSSYTTGSAPLLCSPVMTHFFPLDYLKHLINFQCAYEVQRGNCIEN